MLQTNSTLTNIAIKAFNIFNLNNQISSRLKRLTSSLSLSLSLSLSSLLISSFLKWRFLFSWSWSWKTKSSQDDGTWMIIDSIWNNQFLKRFASKDASKKVYKPYWQFRSFNGEELYNTPFYMITKCFLQFYNYKKIDAIVDPSVYFVLKFHFVCLFRGALYWLQ